ncbi:MAG: hypothetical protein LC687_03365 [Actinobacteria bacterium]|nr:hypothetical protein [Actinomycetota bacterium]
MLTKYIIAGVAALAVIGGAFAFGYYRGSVAEIRKIEQARAITQEELFDLADTVREQNEELRRIQLEKQELINALEEQATTAEGADNPGVGSTGGLRRLERRWGPNPGTAQ